MTTAVVEATPHVPGTRRRAGFCGRLAAARYRAGSPLRAVSAKWATLGKSISS